MRRQEKTVLFLCTGNYYRSRFAEVLFVALARKMGLRWSALSRALALERGVNNLGPMSRAAIKALQAMGSAMRRAARDSLSRLPRTNSQRRTRSLRSNVPNTCPCCKSAILTGRIRSNSGMSTTLPKCWG